MHVRRNHIAIQHCHHSCTVRHEAIGSSAIQEDLNGHMMNMNKNWLGIICALLVVVVLVLLLGGSRISCHESFWDKDKHIIEISNN